MICTDIDEGAAHVTAAIVDGTGLAQDVRDPDSHRSVARVAAAKGTLAVWVNNAGVLAVGDTWGSTTRRCAAWWRSTCWA